MNILCMPIVEAVLKKFCIKDFSKVKIIGVQHILETTHAMFQYLYGYGLKPENISLLGKCYSTCEEVFKEMEVEGIDVSPGSFSYNSHQSFDFLFNQEIKAFLQQRIPVLLKGKSDAIVVLDDGGRCINALSSALRNLPINTVAIEQTSAGYHEIKGTNLPFQVINVARSPVKLVYESPMIAQAGAERLYLSLRKRELQAKKALIIGGGAIGQAMKARLESGVAVSIFDDNANLSEPKKGLFDQLPDSELIIGCTGKTSIPAKFHRLISKNATLVSVSSSDREFDSVCLRKKIEINQDCHRDLFIENRLLVNSGFPVNFDGDRENIETEKIQLTIALIVAGILQALEIEKATPNELIALDLKFEQFIEKQFLKSQEPLIKL